MSKPTDCWWKAGLLWLAVAGTLGGTGLLALEETESPDQGILWTTTRAS